MLENCIKNKMFTGSFPSQYLFSQKKKKKGVRCKLKMFALSKRFNFPKQTTANHHITKPEFYFNKNNLLIYDKNHQI